MTRLLRTCSLLAVLTAACGDNHSSPDAAIQPDGAVDGGAGTAHPFGVVVSGDFTAGTPGVLSLVNPLTLTVRPNAVAGAVGDDPYLRLIAGNLYIINRSDGNNVTSLNAATLALGSQQSTGAGSNPQDVAVVGTKLYVPALGTAGVVVVQPGMATKTIDLSALDVDGFPDCVSAYAVGTKVYVACGLLDATFTPRGPGKVAVIDTTTDTFLPAQTVTLPFANPQGLIVQSPADSMLGGDLLIALVPDFTDYSVGCLARVTPGATPAAHGCAITNSALAGYVNHADVQSLADGTETLWLAVGAYSPDFSITYGSLRAYDLKAGALAAAAISATTELITDVAGCPNGDVLATDRATATRGIRVFKAGVEATTAPLAIGLPPADGNNMVCYDNNH